MSESNKTILPTPKRIEKAKEEGNFLFSDAVVYVLVLLMGVLFSYWIFADLPQRFDGALHNAIILGQSDDFPTAVKHFLWVLVKEFIPPVAYMLLVVSVFGIIGNLIQVGFVFQTAKIRKGLEHVNPVNNAKNLFSKHTLSNFFMQIFKVSVITFVCYKMISGDVGLSDRIYAHRLDVMGGLIEIVQVSFHVLIVAILCIIPVAVMDYWVKKSLYIKDNMMSHDEVEREHKESEGNPEVKSERKSIARSFVEDDERLPNASAVIRNPTHIAVVVRYEPNIAPVPYVMNIQTEEAALALIEEAKRLKIPLYEDIEFARGIVANGEINHHLPIELSEKIVPFVYWLQNNHPDRVFYQSEFAGLNTRIGDVKR